MLGQLFKAYDIRATYPEPLNEGGAWKIGLAAGRYLTDQATGDPGVSRPRTVLVSRDMRPSSPSLAAALIEGLRAAGADVIDLGMADTSMQYFAINHLGAAGGIQTTASHNPVHYNGFKISGPQARPIGADTGLKQIQAAAETLGEAGTLPAKGALEARDLWAEYREHILRFFMAPAAHKRPMRIVVDASNGMAGKLVPAVFSGLEGVEIIPLNFEITGAFVHEPNPLVAENMRPTQEAVRQHGAAFGACFDGDADRCILCDERGEIIGCDHLTAYLAEHFLRKTEPGGGHTIPGALRGSRTVVYDLRSSKSVEERVRELGGTPRKSRVGHVFMKALLRETRGVFGGELSGHFYFRDNFYADSGAIAFASVIWALGHQDPPLSEAVAPFKRYPQSGEVNFQVEDKAGVIGALKNKYAGIGKIDELDGVTVDAWDAASGNGGFWFNVRPSNTESLLRLNAEATDRPTLERLLAELTPLLGTPDTGSH